MKKTRNRIIRAAACIGVGVAVLGMAVFANFDNANGYGVVKEAAKNTFFSSDNVTADINVSADLEGSNLFGGKALIKKDAGGDVKMQTSSQSYDETGTLVDTDNLMTIQDGYRLSSYTYNTDEGPETHKTKYKMSDRDISEELFTNTEVLDKQIGFLETLADTLIGDIKNNIVLTDSNDGNRTYTINMTGEQLPKYMTAAFSLFNASLRANYENSNEIFDEENANIQTMSEMFLNKNEPYVNIISGSVSIDNAGRISAFNGKVVLTGYDNSGAQKNLNMSLDAAFKDYGTTSIERVNADEYEDMSVSVTTKYAVEEDGSGHMTITESDEDVEGGINGSVILQANNEDGTFSTYTVSSDGKLRDENGNVVTVVNNESSEAVNDAA